MDVSEAVDTLKVILNSRVVALPPTWETVLHFGGNAVSHDLSRFLCRTQRLSHVGSPPSESMQLNCPSSFAQPPAPLAVFSWTHQSFLPSETTFAMQSLRQPEPSFSVMKVQSYSFFHCPLIQMSAKPSPWYM